MWDCEPVLYWRCRIGGKLTWRKAKAAFIPSMGMYAIEPPKFVLQESSIANRLDSLGDDPEVKVIESEE